MSHTPSQQARLLQQSRSKVSPAKALRTIIATQRLGYLTVIDPNDPSIGWRVYVGGGQIYFAQSSAGQQERLWYLLRRHRPNLSMSQPQEWSSDYDFLVQYWQSHRLSFKKLQNFLAILTQDALVQCLAIPQAQIQFEPKIGLDPLLHSASLKSLILPLREQIIQWAQLRTQISSPLQRPFIKDRNQFQQYLSQAAKTEQLSQELSHRLSHNRCLYQLAYDLRKDVKDLAVALHPLVASGAAGIRPYGVIKEQQRPLIACVDDSKTIQHFVKLALESSGYTVLQLTDPTKAIPQFLEHAPQLILMDVEMPKLDGNELSRKLSQIEPLSKIPIVMLTSRGSITDQVRSRLAGAVAYLTKPCNPQELLSVIEKLISVPTANGE